MDTHKIFDINTPANLTQREFNELLYHHQDVIIKLLKEYLELGFKLYKQGVTI